MQHNTYENEVRPCSTEEGMFVTYMYRSGTPLPTPVNLAQLAAQIQHEQALLGRCARRVQAFRAELQRPQKDRAPRELLRSIIEADRSLRESPFYRMLARRLNLKL